RKNKTDQNSQTITHGQCFEQPCRWRSEHRRLFSSSGTRYRHLSGEKQPGTDTGEQRRV
ncbi:hypothetical protein A2U01_0115316, partial [Trifolium medium]|nr:hypothetical protein [Trifolium medium]